jgi:hypothetical protein
MIARIFVQGTVANCGRDCPAKSDLLLRFQRVMMIYSQSSPSAKRKIISAAA